MKIDAISLYNLQDALVEYAAGEEIIKIKTPDHEEGFGLIVKNDNASADAEIVIKGGNSVMAMGDITVTVPKGEEILINFTIYKHNNIYNNFICWLV